MTQRGEFSFGEDAGWELDERFADWVDGRLNSAELQGLEAEFAEDPELRAAAESYRATVSMLRRELPGADAMAPPVDLLPRVMNQLAAERLRSRPRRLWPVVGSLAAAAAMVGLYVFLNDLSSRSGFEREGDLARSAPVFRPADEADEAGEAGQPRQPRQPSQSRKDRFGGAADSKQAKPSPVGDAERARTMRLQKDAAKSTGEVTREAAEMATDKSMDPAAPQLGKTGNKTGKKRRNWREPGRVAKNKSPPFADDTAGAKTPRAKALDFEKPGRRLAAQAPTAGGPDRKSDGSDELHRLAEIYLGEVATLDEVLRRPVRTRDGNEKRFSRGLAQPDEDGAKSGWRRVNAPKAARRQPENSQAGTKQKGQADADQPPAGLDTGRKRRVQAGKDANLGEQEAEERVEADAGLEAEKEAKSRRRGRPAAPSVAPSVRAFTLAEATPVLLLAIAATKRQVPDHEVPRTQADQKRADRGDSASEPERLGSFFRQQRWRDRGVPAPVEVGAQLRRSAATAASKSKGESTTSVRDGLRMPRRYLWQAGDEAYLVAGDQAELRLFFEALRGYLQARRPAVADRERRQGRGGHGGRGSGRRDARLALEAIQVQRLAGLSLDAEAGADAEADAEAGADAGDGKLRFVLVLRATGSGSSK